VGLASNQLDTRAVVEAAGALPVFTSAISIGELSFGVRSMRAAYLRQVESRPVLDVSKHTAAAFGFFAAAVKQSGRPPRARYHDLWIAAQAIEHEYILLTLKTGDFTDLPGLRIPTLAPKSQE
jgi:predicted nucleic acid-binding protein